MAGAALEELAKHIEAKLGKAMLGWQHRAAAS